MVEPVTYTPGSWFMAKSVDEMRAFFLSRLPAIREAAQGCGYAIGVHGSERRDFDLIAVPWRDGCDSPDALARAIAIAACGLMRQGAYEWETKPLGRLAVSLPICWCERWADDMAGAGHIDLSVMAPNSAQIARLTIERDGAIADAKEIRARWNDAVGAEPVNLAEPDEEVCQKLAALGWQKIVCGMCGHDGARGYPRAATPLPSEPLAAAASLDVAKMVEALSELLSLIQRNASELSGKVVGNAKAVLAAATQARAAAPEPPEASSEELYERITGKKP